MSGTSVWHHVLWKCDINDIFLNKRDWLLARRMKSCSFCPQSASNHRKVSVSGAWRVNFLFCSKIILHLFAGKKSPFFPFPFQCHFIWLRKNSNFFLQNNVTLFYCGTKNLPVRHWWLILFYDWNALQEQKEQLLILWANNLSCLFRKISQMSLQPCIFSITGYFTTSNLSNDLFTEISFSKSN